MEIDLSLSGDRIPTHTPKVAKKIVSCIVEYEDGTTLELPVELDQGFHRTSDHRMNGKQLITHEIFIAYGKDE